MWTSNCDAHKKCKQKRNNNLISFSDDGLKTNEVCLHMGYHCSFWFLSMSFFWAYSIKKYGPYYYWTFRRKDQIAKCTL